MKPVNKIAIIREKLELYSKPYITSEYLQKILDKFAPNYSIKDLCQLELLIPIKKGKTYINNKTKAIINSFVVGDLYMGDDLYVFGGLGIYNRYSLTEQIAEWQTIYNTKKSGKKIIGNSKFIFVKQRESFFYGIKNEKFEGYPYKIMSIERAFIQMIKEGKEFNNLPYGVDKNKLEKLAKKYASKTINNKIKKYVH